MNDQQIIPPLRWNPFSTQKPMPNPYDQLILEEIEKKLSNNPSYVTELSNDIYSYFVRIQRKNQPDLAEIKTKHKSWVSSSKHINEKYFNLIKTIIYLHSKLNLHDDSWFLSCNIITRFLGKCEKKITNDLQLLLIGITSLFIATKVEETSPLKINQLVYSTNYCYSKSWIINMEYQILSALEFDLLSVSPLLLLKRLVFICDFPDNKVLNIARVWLENSLEFIIFYNYTPMQRASAAWFLACKWCKINDSWSYWMKFHSGLDEKDIRLCAKEMIWCLKYSLGRGLHVIIDKYSNNDKVELSIIFSF